jgi:hypothetical protein
MRRSDAVKGAGARSEFFRDCCEEIGLPSALVEAALGLAAVLVVVRFCSGGAASSDAASSACQGRAVVAGLVLSISSHLVSVRFFPF